MIKTQVYNEEQVRAAFEDMLETCSVRNANERKRIEYAYKIAEEAHRGMARKSGEPYILHPIAVAKIVSEEIGLGPTSVICALLHDVVEDTDISLDDLQKAFNREIAQIIDGLTKIKGVFESKNWVEQQAESVRKILLTLGDDIRVVLIKIADRLHNMRTMDAMPSHKQIRIASETMYIYAPIAHRLGLYRIKSELEDLSMKYTNREIYSDIARKLNEKKNEREAFIKQFIDPLKQKLTEHGFKEFRIFGRPKHIFSIWNKIKTKKVSFENIYDLFAIRIIVDVHGTMEQEKAECWKVYSIITSLYQPKPDRLRDWISTPKGNGYESLHTTVMGPHGKWIEVQIRTERMDKIAERGVAAHWRYKGHKSNGKFDIWLSKIRDFLASKDTDSAIEFITDFRHNLYESDIYVFTPRGDIRNLPHGASVLDFAFDVHTEVGSSCIGAKIDGHLYPITHKLKNGDQVEILTSKKQKPNEEWLNHTITSRARTKIKSILKNAKRKEAEIGKEMLERKLRNLKVRFNKNVINELVHHFKMQDSLEFYFAIATNKFDLKQLKDLTFNGDKIVVKKEKETQSINEEIINKRIRDNTPKDDGHAISVFGGFADRIDYSVASCCEPLPGDDVFGFITISKGIRIHRTDCPNANDLRQRYPYRVVSTKWAKQSQDVLFLTNIRINGMDDVGLVNKLTSIISDELKLNMRAISLDAKDGIFEGKITVFVKNKQQLSQLIKKLRAVEGIFTVERLS